MNCPKVSIIILNWNGIDDTIKCLESLKKITYPDYEVIVVDNGSTGNDVVILEEKYQDYIRLIKNERNLGFSGGNNVAIEEVLREDKSKYILLLNNDTIVSSDFLTELINIIEKDSKIGAVTPEILNPNGSLQRSNRKFPTPFLIFLSFCLPKIFLSTKVKNFVAKTNLKKLLGSTVNSYFWSFDSEKPVEIENASGACLLIRKETIKEVGMLDENIFLSSEDADWCYRIKKDGWKILYIPKAKITHYVSKSFKNKMTKLTYLCHRIKSEYYFVKKHYKKTDVLKTKFILLLTLIFRFPLFLNKNLWKIYQDSLKSILR